MDSLLFLLFTIIYLVILISIVKILKKSPILSLFFLLPVVIGLLYDNGVITLGKFLGEGTLTEKLNLMRYLLHALFTPFLVFYAWAAIKKTKSNFAKKTSFNIAPFIVTPILILLELFTEVIGLQIFPKWQYGVLSYSSESGGGPPLMVILVSVVLLIASIIVLIKQKWGWFFIGSLLMIIMSAVQLPINSNAVTNLFEVTLILSLFATSIFQEKKAV